MSTIYYDVQDFYPTLGYQGATNSSGNLWKGVEYNPVQFQPTTMGNQDTSSLTNQAIQDTRSRQQSANDLTRQRMQSSGGMSAADSMALNQGGAKRRAKSDAKANMWGDIMQDRTDTDVANYNAQLGNMAEMFNAGQNQQANMFNTANTMNDQKKRWEFIQQMLEIQGKLDAGQQAAGIY